MSGQNSAGENREWVEGMLSAPEFVEWDRYTRAVIGEDLRIDVYGWIEREHDEYKDFVLLCLWPDEKDYEFTTSSARYSEDLYRMWEGTESLDDHSTCRRVEDGFDISNATTLDERPVDSNTRD